MFDLRHLEHSTIIYETGPPDSPTTPPLLRLCWNQEVRKGEKEEGEKGGRGG